MPHKTNFKQLYTKAVINEQNIKFPILIIVQRDATQSSLFIIL